MGLACKGGITYNEIADNNLHNLGLEAGSATEDLLQKPDEKVTKWCTDKGAVRCHLGNTRGEVVAMLIAILGEP